MSGAEDNGTAWAYRHDALLDESVTKQERETLEALRKARRKAARQAQAEVSASADDAEDRGNGDADGYIVPHPAS